MSELTVALIGCEGLGRLHLNAWKPQSGVRIAAICDTQGGRVAEVARAIEGVAAFTDYRDALNSEQFDIVDVCLPLEDRASVIEYALKSGANVISETPLSLSLQETERLNALAIARERLLMPCLVHRFHPPALFLKELMENDDIGTPVSFRCRFSDTRLFFGALNSETFDQETLGVGLTTALHGIDLFRFLIGEVEEIVGMSRTLTPGLGAEDSAVMLLRGVRGTLGVVEAYQNLPGSRNLLEIYGTVGAALLDYDTNLVRFNTLDQPVWNTQDVSGINSFEGALAHFADSLRGLQTLSVTGDDAVRAQSLCMKALNNS